MLLRRDVPLHPVPLPGGMRLRVGEGLKRANAGASR